MERAAFLIEQTGERLGCMLNPNSIVVRRSSGISTRQSGASPLIGRGLTDDPLIYTGGGATELRLKLLFDIGIAGSSIETQDVRDLTGPLWNLAENAAGDDGNGRPSPVRFVWGKFWNVPGVIASIAERLEYFSETGAPRRSFLSLRMLRVSEPGPSAVRELPASAIRPGPGLLDTAEMSVHEVEGQGQGGGSGERVDELAHRYYGDSRMWRWICAANGIDDPAHLPAGASLRVPAGPAGGIA